MGALTRPALPLLAVLLACAGPAPGRPAAQPPRTTEVTVHDVPPLPAGILLQLAVRETGEVYRVADDGRYLVSGPGGQEHEARPRSRRSPGADRLTPEALVRLRSALDAARLDTLPDSIPGASALGPDVLPVGGRWTLRHYVFTARPGPIVRSVEVVADARLDESFGALAGLFRALDDEALGGWRLE